MNAEEKWSLALFVESSGHAVRLGDIRPVNCTTCMGLEAAFAFARYLRLWELLSGSAVSGVPRCTPGGHAVIVTQEATRTRNWVRAQVRAVLPRSMCAT